MATTKPDPVAAKAKKQKILLAAAGGVFLLLALIPTLASASPVINEFVAENQHGITDEDGSHSDWVEIYNPDPAPADMTGWFLTDDAMVMNKWAFPAVTIPPGGFLVVFASGKNRAVAGSSPRSTTCTRSGACCSRAGACRTDRSSCRARPSTR